LERREIRKSAPGPSLRYCLLRHAHLEGAADDVDSAPVYRLAALAVLALFALLLVTAPSGVLPLLALDVTERVLKVLFC
jgi:hypothetical protein